MRSQSGVQNTSHCSFFTTLKMSCWAASMKEWEDWTCSSKPYWRWATHWAKEYKPYDKQLGLVNNTRRSIRPRFTKLIETLHRRKKLLKFLSNLRDQRIRGSTIRREDDEGWVEEEPRIYGPLEIAPHEGGSSIHQEPQAKPPKEVQQKMSPTW